MGLPGFPRYAAMVMVADPDEIPGFRLPKLVATPDVVYWFDDDLVPDVDKAAKQEIHISKTAQGASIGTTSFGLGTVHPGIYRVNCYARITRAASTSSSLIVTIAWTDGSVSQTHSFTALTGNLTTTTLKGPPLVIRVDASSVISYATTYASVGGTSMIYRADLVLESLALEAA